MRRPLVAGNWKMHLDRASAVALAGALTAPPSVDVAVCPPFPYLLPVGQVLGGGVALGAQDVHWEEKGAHTGEVAPPMLVDCGCRHAIVGHSERRAAGETDEVVNRKLRAALAAGLSPILCVGEQLEQRDAGQENAVVEAQVDAGLRLVSAGDAARIVIAYEPVWAIGTGRTASPEQAQAMHAHVREVVARRYDAALAGATRILYGGSVKPGNAAGLFAMPDIDGGLVGGAALDAGAFAQIIAAAAG